MNEFTKEELEELRYCVTFAHGDDNGLADKLQSMLDNYCEHEDTRQICDADYVEVCADCDETLGFL